jgi:uncharacterized protein YjbJ (UPF0337 family)
MNWDQIEGKWKQMKGSAKQHFGKLTDDDLEQIRGQRDMLVGKIQERYGVAKEQAQKQADEWLTTAGNFGGTDSPRPAAQAGMPKPTQSQTGHSTGGQKHG